MSQLTRFDDALPLSLDLVFDNPSSVVTGQRVEDGLWVRFF